MEISRAAVAVVAAGCLTAGAAAGYVATRSASVPITSPAESAVVDPVAEGVEQSEAIVAVEPPAPPAPVAAPAPRPPVPVRPPAPKPSREPARPAPPPPPARDVVQEVTQVAPAPITPGPIQLPTPPVLEPAAAELEELVLSGDSVIGLQMESTLSSETASVEDQVVAHVTRDVKVGDRVAIPAGSKVRGEVILVERGGKMRERARLGVRFTSIVLADGATVPIATQPIYREGEAPGRESATKIGGGAIGGAIIGGILGGAKGAAIGGSIGAGAGSAAVFAGGRNPATLSAGSPVTVRLNEPATITVER
jgi:type IV secretory pathway VirB10-like protein